MWTVIVAAYLGEHLREVRGDWGNPRSFCYVEDRIYLLEYLGFGNDGDELDNGEGRRIIVLTPEGVTLQIYTPNPEVLREFSGSRSEPDCFVHVAHFDGRLVVAALNCDCLFALQGL